MSSKLSRSLLRSLLRFGKRPSFKEASLSLDPSLLKLSKDQLPKEYRSDLTTKLIQSSDDLRSFAVESFRNSEDSSENIDAALEALRLLNARSMELDKRYELRQHHIMQAGNVKFCIGDIVQHSETSTRAIVCGWSIDEEDGSQHLMLLVDQLDASEHLKAGSPLLTQPSEEGVAASQFVAVEDPVLQRICNDSTALYFNGFDAITGKFIPTDDLAYCFPLDNAHLRESYALTHENDVNDAGNMLAARLKEEEERYEVIQALSTLTEAVAEEITQILQKNGLWNGQLDAIIADNIDETYDVNVMSTSDESDQTAIARNIVEEVVGRVLALKKLSQQMNALKKSDPGSISANEALCTDTTIYQAITNLSSCYQTVDHLLENRFQENGRGYFELQIAKRFNPEQVQPPLLWEESSDRAIMENEDLGMRNFAPAAFRVGEIVVHKKFGYRGIVMGWDVRPLVDVSRWEAVVGLPSGVEQPFYRILPDEGDVENFLGPNAFRSSYYVAEENLELVKIDDKQSKRSPSVTSVSDSGEVNEKQKYLDLLDDLQQTWHIRHRYMDLYFSNYDSETGRYIAHPRIRFQYPDHDNYLPLADSSKDTSTDIETELVELEANGRIDPIKKIQKKLESMEGGLKQQLAVYLHKHVQEERSKRSRRIRDVDAFHQKQAVERQGMQLAEDTLFEIHAFMKNIFNACRERGSNIGFNKYDGGKDPSTSTDCMKLKMEDLAHLLRSARRREDAIAIESIIWIVWASHRDYRVSGEMSKGVDDMKAGKTSEAFHAFKKASLLDPQYSEAWNKIAALHHKVDQSDKCAENAERCLKLFPGHFGALAGLSMALEKKGNSEEALNCLKTTLKAHPWATRGSTVLQALTKKVEEERLEAVSSVLAGIDAVHNKKLPDDNTGHVVDTSTASDTNPLHDAPVDDFSKNALEQRKKGKEGEEH
jgi:hemimethylated DNA binding protein